MLPMEPDHRYFVGVRLDRSHRWTLQMDSKAQLGMCHKECRKGGTYVPSKPKVIHWCDRCQVWFHRECTEPVELSRENARENNQTYLCCQNIGNFTISHLASLPIVRRGVVNECPQSIELLISCARQTLESLGDAHQISNWRERMIAELPDVKQLDQDFIMQVMNKLMKESDEVEWRCCPKCLYYI